MLHRIRNSSFFKRIVRAQNKTKWNNLCFIKRSFVVAFPREVIKVAIYGNMLAAVALLEGIVSEELIAKELDHVNLDY